MKAYLESWTGHAFNENKKLYFCSNKKQAAYMEHCMDMGKPAIAYLFSRTEETRFFKMDVKKKLDYLSGDSYRKYEPDCLNCNKKSNGYVPGRFPFEVENFKEVTT